MLFKIYNAFLITDRLQKSELFGTTTHFDSRVKMIDEKIMRLIGESPFQSEKNLNKFETTKILNTKQSLSKNSNQKKYYLFHSKVSTRSTTNIIV